MDKSLILKSHSNEILQYIKANDLNIYDFSWEEVYSTKSHPLVVSKLVNNSSAYYFIFDFHKGKHFCEYSPGEEKQVDIEYPGSWNLQLDYFKHWISYLKREIYSPDLWSALKAEKGILEAATTKESNELFSSEEKIKLKANLNEIKLYIFSTKSLQSNETSFIENRINYLVESSERLGKKDWINITLGVLINIILFLSLPAEAAGELFRFASNTLKWLISESLKLLK